MKQFSAEDLQQFALFPSILLIKADKKGVVEIINENGAKVLGRLPEEIVGHGLSKFVHSDSNTIISFNPEIQQVHFSNNNRDGVWINLLTRSTANAFYLLGRVVNDEHANAERFRFMSERLSLVLKMSNIGTFEYWPNTNLVISDETIEKIYGIAPGTSPTEINEAKLQNHPDDMPAIRAGVARCVSEMVPFSLDHRIIRPNGEVRWVSCWIRPFVEESGSIRVIGSIKDITETRSDP